MSVGTDLNLDLSPVSGSGDVPGTAHAVSTGSGTGTVTGIVPISSYHGRDYDLNKLHPYLHPCYLYVYWMLMYV